MKFVLISDCYLVYRLSAVSLLFINCLVFTPNALIAFETSRGHFFDCLSLLNFSCRSICELVQARYFKETAAAGYFVLPGSLLFYIRW